MASQPSSRDCYQGLCTAYCRQWCYSLFPPPPPFQFAGAVDGDDDPPSGRAFSPLVIAIIAILASALLLLTYYTLVSRFCRRRRSSSGPPPADPADTSTPSHGPPSSAGLDEALISRMSVYRYRKGEGLVEGTDCSVCLGEFGHGQSLRLLPECTHAFHVDCIDTWLKSHSNCPICRAGVVWAGPAPPPPPSRPDGEAVVVVVDQDSSRQS